MVIIKLRLILIIFVFSLVVFLHFHSDRFSLVKSRKTLLFKVKWAWFCPRNRLALCICLLAPGMLEAGLRRHGCTSSLVSNCFSLLFPCSNTEIPRWQRKILWQLEKMTFSDHLKTLHDHFVCRFDFLLYNNTDGLDFYFWSLLQWVLSLGLCWHHSLGERLICRAELQFLVIDMVQSWSYKKLDHSFTHSSACCHCLCHSFYSSLWWLKL